MQTNPLTGNNTPGDPAGASGETSATGASRATNTTGTTDTPNTTSTTSTPGEPTGDEAQRNFSTISPSAYSLLLMKGLTAIPFARQAAELLIAPTPYTPDLDNRQPLFWGRLLHFENRYWSINQLMAGLPITNILELSSGFSFRGLALSREKPMFYIDTDLPELIATKQKFVEAFESGPNLAPIQPSSESNLGATDQPPASPNIAATDQPNPTAAPQPPGHYELQPLNVLDEPAFDAIIDRFPPGELLIVNEGLLMYLDEDEKQRLCRIIHRTLQRRGGYWITADIYIQKELDPALIDSGDSLHQFLKQHKVEEKKFRDFESAAEFFTRMGFI